MNLTKEAVAAALDGISHPQTGEGLSKAISKVTMCDGYVTVNLLGGGLGLDQQGMLKKAVDAVVRAAARSAGDEITRVEVQFVAGATPAAGPAPRPSAPAGGGGGHAPIKTGAQAPPGQGSAPVLPGVKHVIAVGAGKGGVGKSTVAVNLAVGLARRGHAVGIVDGDIYGPSLPTMLGLEPLEPQLVGHMLQPFAVHGVKAMTIGKLVDPQKPLVWRGPMAHGAFKQLIEQTAWGELDYLIIDLPPGTGDIALSMAQLIKLTGAVIVCTPQKVAQDDAVRALKMFQQLNVEVLGVVENMSYFIGDDGKEYDLFGRGGAQQMAQRLGVPFLGAVPITMALRVSGDEGDPTANFAGGLGRDLESMVRNVESQAALASMKVTATGPTLTIS